MAEPHITATGAAVGLAAAPPLIVLGAQVDALVIGLAAAILVTFWMETIDSKLKSGAAMVFSALLAGYGSPVGAEVVIGLLAPHVPAASLDGGSLRLLLALALGAGSPYLIPLLLRRAGRKIGEDVK